MTRERILAGAIVGLAGPGQKIAGLMTLTVVRADDYAFAVALIPHTIAVTALGRKEVGGRVNLEVDMIAKYVERLLGAYPRDSA